MTRDEYAQGLVDILRVGWSFVPDTLETRFQMGLAETYWLMLAPKSERKELFSYGRRSIWLTLGDEKVSLQAYLGRY